MRLASLDIQRSCKDVSQKITPLNPNPYPPKYILPPYYPPNFLSYHFPFFYYIFLIFSYHKINIRGVRGVRGVKIEIEYKMKNINPNI